MPIGTIQEAENAAFAFERTLDTSNVDERELVDFARRLLSEAIDAGPDGEELDAEQWDGHNRRKFDASARVLSSLAARIGDASLCSYFTTLAVIAFCLDGNHAAAICLARDELERGLTDSSLLTAIGISCPVLSLRCAALTRDDRAQDLLRLAHGAITGAVPLADVIQASVQYERSVREPGLGYLLAFATRALHTAIELRFDKLLSGVEFKLKARLLRGLRDQQRYLALPSQAAALINPGVLDPARPCLISLPTGAGKTVVGLMSAACALGGPGDVAAFIAPYLAIRRQVEEAATTLLGESVAVLSGVRNDVGDRPTLIIDTPEAFDARLRKDPRLRDRLKCVVLDEAHLLGNDARGALADGVITRCAMRGGRPLKVVFLSAVLDENGPLLEWLGDLGDVAEVVSRWRPTARRIAVWNSAGALAWIRTIGNPSGQSSAYAVAREVVEPPFPVLPFGHPAASTGPRYSQADANVAALTMSLWNRDSKCTLIVAGTRARARAIAKLVALRLRAPDALPPSIVHLIGEIQESYAEFADLIPMVEKGVAYHSAALPPKLRSEIERVCASGGLRCVAATTTLAEGTDLPFGRTVLADWTFRFDVDRHQAFKPYLWRNIAGRCGRPSSHIEGETIIVQDSAATAFASATQRAAALRSMLLERVRLESVFAVEGRRHDMVQEQMLSQVIAAIYENGALEDVHAVLAHRMLAARLTDVGSVAGMVEYLENRLVGGDEPIASRNSPLRLTEKGEALRRAAVLPDVAERLLELLRIGRPIDTPVELCAMILRGTAHCTETQSTPMAAILAGKPPKGLWVRNDEIEAVCSDWLDGVSVGELLLRQAEKNRRTTRAQRIALQKWISGDATIEGWQVYYEKLFDFCRSLLADYLPRAISSVVTICEVAPNVIAPATDLHRVFSQLTAAGRRLSDGDTLELLA